MLADELLDRVGGGRFPAGHTGARHQALPPEGRYPYSFAAAVDGRAVETRRELLREAQYWLTEWEHHRREEHLGRLLQTLDTIALLVRSSR